MTDYALLLLAIPVLGTLGVVAAIEISSRFDLGARGHTKGK